MNRDALEIVGWGVKDFADGWILFRSEADARKEADFAGNLVAPVYVHTDAALPVEGEPVAYADQAAIDQAKSVGRSEDGYRLWGEPYVETHVALYSAEQMAAARMGELEAMNVLEGAETKLATLTARNAALEEALRGSDDFIGGLQVLMRMYLEPGDRRIQSHEQLVNALLRRLDGPEQREVQEQTKRALTDSGKEPPDA